MKAEIYVTVSNNKDKALWREAEARTATWEDARVMYPGLKEKFIRDQKEVQKTKYYATH